MIKKVKIQKKEGKFVLTIEMDDNLLRDDIRHSDIMEVFFDQLVPVGTKPTPEIISKAMRIFSVKDVAQHIAEHYELWIRALETTTTQKKYELFVDYEGNGEYAYRSGRQRPSGDPAPTATRVLWDEIGPTDSLHWLD